MFILWSTVPMYVFFIEIYGKYCDLNTGNINTITIGSVESYKQICYWVFPSELISFHHVH